MENNEQNLEGVETPTSDAGTQKPVDNIDYKAEYEKMKMLKDKYSKESADWKTKYNSTLSDVEKERVANEEREAYYKNLEREVNLAKFYGGLSKNIGDEKVAKSISEKLVDGDNFGAINELNEYLTALKDNIAKQTKEDLLKSNPTPPPASANTSDRVSKAEFDKMSYTERCKLKEKDPELYKKLAK